MHRKNKIKVILCGGGTGGHIFPMISIANELKNENKENEILFVGSRDRMEMEIVPKHNFKIICLLYTSPSPRDLYRSRMPSSA